MCSYELNYWHLSCFTDNLHVRYPPKEAKQGCEVKDTEHFCRVHAKIGRSTGRWHWLHDFKRSPFPLARWSVQGFYFYFVNTSGLSVQSHFTKSQWEFSTSFIGCHYYLAWFHVVLFPCLVVGFFGSLLSFTLLLYNFSFLFSFFFCFICGLCQVSSGGALLVLDPIFFKQSFWWIIYLIYFICEAR